MVENLSKTMASLIDIHGDYLFNYALLRVSRREIAEDMVQETYISAFKSYSTFKGKSSPKTWLTSILKNKIIDYYRKSANKKELKQDLPEEKMFDDLGQWLSKFAPDSHYHATDAGIIQEEFYEILKKCLSHLTESQRVAFNMKMLDDCESEEICKELGLTSSNYWTIMHRIRIQMRKCLEKLWMN